MGNCQGKQSSRSRKHITIHDRAQSGDINGFQKVLQKDPSLINKRNAIMLETPLHLSAGNNKTKIVKFLLEWKGDDKVDLEAKNMCGETPLHLAAKNGCNETARLLLAHGALVDAQTEYGVTPLKLSVLHSVRTKDCSIVKTLLENNADYNATDDEGMTVLDHLSKIQESGKLSDVFLSHQEEQRKKKVLEACSKEKEKMDALDKELSNIVGLDELKMQLRKWAKSFLVDERRKALGLIVGTERPPRIPFQGNPVTAMPHQRDKDEDDMMDEDDFDDEFDDDFDDEEEDGMVLPYPRPPLASPNMNFGTGKLPHMAFPGNPITGRALPHPGLGLPPPLLKVGTKTSSHGILGNPGTGKTMVARTLGRLLHSAGILRTPIVKEVQRTDLVGEYIGKTGPKTREKIKQAEGGILFVDEAYRLIPWERCGRDFGLEALEEIMSCMDSGKVLVIFAGYNEPMQRVISSNEGFSRRVTNIFKFKDLSCEELGNLLHIKMSNQAEDNLLYGFKLHSSCSENAIAELIQKETTKVQRMKMNGGLVDIMLNNGKENLDFRITDDCVESDELLTIKLEDFEAALRFLPK
ncbi:uncharacterized protein LOC116139073 isoform X1 [Pistacia vera]|uniref:uncharacterized protein LOC116139073 isoform X1 n=1 Tax=Pistacia vera TaxID=55513 RepID=UPI0012635045|nr:uncharacterized protein LOC116139073 isoform X1 [Pistacia vera]